MLANQESLLRVSAWSRWSLVLAALALLVVTVGFVALPRGDADGARYVIAMVVAGVALVAVVVRSVRSVRVRGRLGTAHPTVMTVLTARERQAVNRAVAGRASAPVDRRRIVRAAAVLRADTLRIERPIWFGALSSALVLGSSSSSSDRVIGILYGVSAVLFVVGAAIAWADVLRVRRALRAVPGPWDAPAASV